MVGLRVLSRLLSLLIVVAIACVTSPTAAAAGSKRPVISSISPAAGSVNGGNLVTITGKRLSGTTQVLFGASRISDVSNISATEIRVTAPKHVTGEVDIRVTTPAGTSPVSSKARYGYQPANTGSRGDGVSTVFNVILHVLLLGSLLAFFAGIIWTALFGTQQHTGERMLRIGGIFAGAMVAVGAQASGADYPTYIVSVMTNVSGAWLVHIVATVVPGLLGMVLGFTITMAMHRNNPMAIRLMGFVGMLATTSFLQIYAQAATLKGFNLGAAALPNIAFSTGVILTVVFTLHRGERANKDSSLVRMLLGFLLANGNKGRVGSAQPTTTSLPTVERDPFLRP
jgi:hypothetical protein